MAPKTLLAGVWIALLAALAPAQGASDSLERWLENVRGTLDAKDWGAALERVTLGLEYYPDESRLLELAASAAQENGESDLALWYAELALEALADEVDPKAKEKPQRVVELERIVELVDPLQRKGDLVIGEYRQAMFDVGRSIGKRKLYANAVDLLSRSRALGLGANADEELAKIYDNKKAVEALLETGLDVPLKAKKKRKSAEALAKEDLKRSVWEQAYEIKGDNYTIKTNMGLEMAESMSLAMEQVNRFYRKVFKVKERGGNTARVVVSVYKSRAEFEKFENLKEDQKNMLAFFVPNQNRVAAYDLREHGYAIGELWSTLFHEASHQFTHLVSADLIPGWLNEGTASYFEGARLLPNGSVEMNLIPEERLFYLEKSLRAGAPTLQEVVSYYQPGSYDGEFYPFGWGLVYFLLNYENEACERIYVPVYQDYMAAYGTGGKHDPFQRFVDFFVVKAKDPAIKSFADFEARWKGWILALHGLYFGDASQADVLIARARKQAAAKKLEAAAESYRWALKKRPGDVTALVELGDLLARDKALDAALYFYRQALVGARGVAQASAPIAERSTKQIAALDEDLGKALAAAEGKLFSACDSTAAQYIEKDFPRAALRMLDRAALACGGSARLSETRAKIAAEHEVDTRRWRRPLLEPGLSQWRASELWKPDGDALFAKIERTQFATWNPVMPARYRVEVRWKDVVLEPGGFIALTFGAADGALQYFGVSDDGLAEVGRIVKTWEPLEELGLIPLRALESVTIAIDVAPEKTVFSVDGKVVHERAYLPDELAGRVGVVLQRGSAGFEGLRVRY
ncbi:MAG: hypothetical protein IT454_20745 [Planctomycetes bacterium]|nr:hypothetical protein [Planctomycetota bacterium]